MDEKTLAEYVEKKYIIICPICGKYNAFDYNDTNMNQTDIYPWAWYRDSDCLEDVEDIYPIGAADCISWQCNKCREYILDDGAENSAYMSECYTHINWNEIEESEI